MTIRSDLKSNFLKTYKLTNYHITPLKHDASMRRYDRLTKDNHSIVLMDAPPEFESIKDFIDVTNFLSKHGFSTPKIYHYDISQGFLVLEDFGNDIINIYLNNYPERTDFIYFLAIDNLIKLANISPPNHFPKHDKNILMSGIEQFQTFYLESQDKELTLECSNLFSQLDYTKNYICLRDYHADNLIYLQERQSYKKIGLLDYQDACSGFLSYDLLSLLQDARKYISPQLQEKYLQYFLDNIPNLNQEEFLKEYDILSFQRNARIIGLFHKLNKKDQNSSYLKYLDNVLQYFVNNLQSKYLAKISKILVNKQKFIY